jgi:HPt (histidine-containing phosphotransfer) domain-containing protein
MDLATLADDLGLEEEDVRRLILTFLDATEQDLVELDRSFSEQDAEKMRETAHHIKGAAGNLEFSEIARMALELEDEARSGMIADPTDRIASIKSRLSTIRSELSFNE